MTQRVYVTGAAGMIGSNVVCDLLSEGYFVIGVDDLSRGTPSDLDIFKYNSNFEFKKADIALDDSWATDINQECIIVHTADIVGGIGYVFDNEWAIFQKNILINTQIAQIARTKKPQHLIYLGTACSYPQGMQKSINSSVLSEKNKFPADPESGYGWSKLIGDIEFHLAIKNSSTRLTVLDLHNVYGWPCVYNDASAQVIPSLINRAMKSENGILKIWGDGNQGRGFIHVSDVVSAVRSSLCYKGTYDNFMIGPDACTTISKIAQIIARDPRLNIISLEYDIAKPVGDIGRYANADRAKAELGWSPKTDLEYGLRSLIDKILAHWALGKK